MQTRVFLIARPVLLTLALLTLALLTLALLTLARPTLAQAGNTPVGTWKTIDDKTKKPKSLVKIYAGKGGRLYGKIVKLFRGKNEEKNPKCTKCKDWRKGKPVIGLQIIDGLLRDGDAWAGGNILDPANGKTYRCKVWPEGKKKLKVRGYIAFFFRTQTWLRVK